jgi:hypothetical protein
MTKLWIRIIAVLEIIGGIFGILFVAWQIAVSPINIFTIIIGLVILGIYVLSLIAGVALWQGRPFGRTASIIVQAIQLPKIISPTIIFTFSFGLDLWIHFLLSETMTNVGFQFRFLAYNEFFLNMQGAPLGLGISIISCIFLVILVRYKAFPELEADILPPAPVQLDDQTHPQQLTHAIEIVTCS